MTTLQDIEARAKQYADARGRLADQVGDLNGAIAALKRQHLPMIKRTLARVAEHQAELKALIDGAPSLFTKPRTRVLHGVKLGFAKGKGAIQFDDGEKVCALILKHLPDQADVLFTVRRKPVVAAIAQLAAADIKRIGCRVIDSGDQVVIKPVDSDVDKLVDALLDKVTEAEDEEAEA